MELSRNAVRETRKRTGLGRCRHFFWLGVAFDTAGATVLFTGVFAHLVFSDLLLYLGSIIIFLSLLWWVFWYTGNIELPAEGSSKRPLHVLSSTLVEALSRTVGHRFSLPVCNVSGPLRRFQRRGGRRSFLRTAALDMTVTGQLQSRLEKEDRDKDATKSVREGGDAQDLRGEDLSPKPEPVGRSEGVGPPGPEAGLPGCVEGASSTHLGPPHFVASPPDRPRAPGGLPCGTLRVVPLTSASQPLAVQSSGSQPAAALASAGQPAASLAPGSPPAIILASESLSAVSSTSMKRPGLVLDSQGQSLVPVASQDHPVVPAFAQSNLQALLKASQSCPLVSASTQSTSKPH
ncbi:transmembrane protein 238 [Suricata suricatta]|uniref:transmembrane protein 238 n=1 Tax=Suricata suricatta TaxID=37032 RepID=UPI0011554B56|nr:transmembrane protein 238 [Suricata suricatta]